MRALIDLVAPTRCASCGAVGDDLCASCADRLAVIGPPMCDRCGAPSAVATVVCAGCLDLGGFIKARSLVAFAEPARALTLALKRRGRRAPAATVGTLLADLADAQGLVQDDTTVTFVPGGRRAREVGFDHARLIATGAALALSRPLRAALYRRADGPRQADVSIVQRRDNVAGRFAARPVRGCILLVDDVFTTGATAEACAIALLGAGATSVAVVTWARTLRRIPRS